MQDPSLKLALQLDRGIGQLAAMEAQAGGDPFVQWLATQPLPFLRVAPAALRRGNGRQSGAGSRLGPHVDVNYQRKRHHALATARAIGKTAEAALLRPVDGGPLMISRPDARVPQAVAAIGEALRRIDLPILSEGSGAALADALTNASRDGFTRAAIEMNETWGRPTDEGTIGEFSAFVSEVREFREVALALEGLSQLAADATLSASLPTQRSAVTKAYELRGAYAGRWLDNNTGWTSSDETVTEVLAAADTKLLEIGALDARGVLVPEVFVGLGSAAVIDGGERTLHFS